MSRIGGYLIVCGLLPSLAGAQDMRVLRDRLAREAVLSSRMTREFNEYRSLERRMRSASDTVPLARGNVRVLTDRALAGVVRAAAAQADSALAAIDSLLPRVQGGVFFVAVDSTPRYRPSREPVIQVQFMLPPGKVPSSSEAVPDVEQISRLFEGTILQRVMNRLESPFLKWRRGDLPLRAQDAERQPSWETVRFDVLEAPSLLGPRCYKGDIVACSMQLGLTAVEDPVMAWYDARTRLETVKMNQPRALRFDAASTNRCVNGDDTACGRVLHRLHLFETPPSGPAARDALTWQALQMGGPGAVMRLLMTPGTASDALAAAAKAPIDSVVRTWHRNMRNSGLGSEDLTLRIVLVAVAWVGALLLLATRINRWR